MDGHRSQELAGEALRALTLAAGIQGELMPLPAEVDNPCARSDVTLWLNVGERRYSFHGGCVALADRRTILAQIKARLAGLNAPGLLIAPYLSKEMIDSCRAIGLQAIDTAGNAYLEVPGLFVLIKGQEAAAAQIRAQERLGSSASSLRMVFVLLVDPGLVQAPYRQIAQAAGIAVGAVGGIFRDLSQRGLIAISAEAQGRHLLEPDRLLDEWVATYSTRLRPKLQSRRFKGPDATWWHAVNPQDLDAWWGGEIAADGLTGLLKPSRQILYVLPQRRQTCLQSLVARFRLQSDPAGEFEILDAFWNLPRSGSHARFVPPLLAYADLMVSLDPRNLEVAAIIREKMCADVRHPS